MDNRYIVKVNRQNTITVIDTKLFRADTPNGICVLSICCGDNRKKMESNLQQVAAEYNVAPQNIKYI